MSNHKIERLIIVAIVLLVLNLLAQFRPYQIRISDNGMFGYRLNVYTGDIVDFNMSGVGPGLKPDKQ